MSKYLSQDMIDLQKDDAYYLALALKTLYMLKVEDKLPAEATKISVEDALLVWGRWPERLALMNKLAIVFNLEFYLMEESGAYYLTLDIPGQTAPDTQPV